jgi:hypothetical protein
MLFKITVQNPAATRDSFIDNTIASAIYFNPGGTGYEAASFVGLGEQGLARTQPKTRQGRNPCLLEGDTLKFIFTAMTP